MDHDLKDKLEHDISRIGELIFFQKSEKMRTKLFESRSFLISLHLDNIFKPKSLWEKIKGFLKYMGQKVHDILH